MKNLSNSSNSNSSKLVNKFGQKPSQMTGIVEEEENDVDVDENYNDNGQDKNTNYYVEGREDESSGFPTFGAGKKMMF